MTQPAAQPLAPPADTCPLCGTAGARLAYAWPDFRVLQCTACGFRFTDLANWSYPYAEADYYEQGSADRVNPDQPHIARRVRDIQKYVSRGRSLDIGCGIGEAALRMSRAGFNAEAIDESPRAIDRLKRQYPQVKWHCGSILQCIDELGQFDVVTMYHVLEHIPHPLEAMRSIRRLLAPGGLLVVELPNAAGWLARMKGKRWQYFERHHVNYFGPSHLRNLAEKLGLEVVETAGFYHLSYPQGVWWKDRVKGALASLGFSDVISIFMRAPR